MTIQDSIRVLRREEDAFATQLAGLLPKHAGEFVVFKDGIVHGLHASYPDAFGAAVERFGPDGLFLVTQIKPREFEGVSVSWAAGVMFAEEPKEQGT